MEQSTAREGKIEIRWSKGQISVQMDISWRLFLASIMLILYSYAPQIVEVLRQVAEMLN